MIKLEVGKRYITNGGKVITITKYSKLDEYDELTHLGDNGFWYRENGIAFKNTDPFWASHNIAKEIE